MPTLTCSDSCSKDCHSRQLLCADRFIRTLLLSMARQTASRLLSTSLRISSGYTRCDVETPTFFPPSSMQHINTSHLIHNPVAGMHVEGFTASAHPTSYVLAAVIRHPGHGCQMVKGPAIPHSLFHSSNSSARCSFNLVILLLKFFPHLQHSMSAGKCL